MACGEDVDKGRDCQPISASELALSPSSVRVLAGAHSATRQDRIQDRLLGDYWPLIVASRPIPSSIRRVRL